MDDFSPSIAKMKDISSINDGPTSAAALIDPGVMKQQMANGTSLSHSHSLHLVPRSGSEPLHESTTPNRQSPTALLHLSKDDTYTICQGKIKKPPGNASTQPGHTSMAYARQLLDPKNFHKARSYKDEVKLPPNASESSSESRQKQVDGNLLSTDCAPSPKRDHEAFEGQGIGRFIEQLYGVSQREERFRKKPKVDADEHFMENKRPTFQGGSKGGEIGEYIKQKKKEGLDEAASVVDLTGGTRPSFPIQQGT